MQKSINRGFLCRVEWKLGGLEPFAREDFWIFKRPFIAYSVYRSHDGYRHALEACEGIAKQMNREVAIMGDASPPGINSSQAALIAAKHCCQDLS